MHDPHQFSTVCLYSIADEMLDDTIQTAGQKFSGLVFFKCLLYVLQIALLKIFRCTVGVYFVAKCV